MIDYIRGELAELTPAQAVVEAAGVGYALNISLNTFSAIQGKKEVKLFVHEQWSPAGATTLSPFSALRRNRSASFIACSSVSLVWERTPVG